MPDLKPKELLVVSGIATVVATIGTSVTRYSDSNPALLDWKPENLSLWSFRNDLWTTPTIDMIVLAMFLGAYYFMTEQNNKWKIFAGVISAAVAFGIIYTTMEYLIFNLAGAADKLPYNTNIWIDTAESGIAALLMSFLFVKAKQNLERPRATIEEVTSINQDPQDSEGYGATGATSPNTSAP